MKAPRVLLKYRPEYYEHVIKAGLKSIGVPLSKLRYVRGGDYQLPRDYALDVYRLSSMVTNHDAKKAGAQVVKQVEYPMLDGLLCPGLQALDEESLKCDVQFGEVYQRKIFMFAEKCLPMLGFAMRCPLMNPMVRGLAVSAESKMSPSDADYKVDMIESHIGVVEKIKRGFCEEGNLIQNGLLTFFKKVIFPVTHRPMVLASPAKYGGNMQCATYDELELSFAQKETFCTPDTQTLIAKTCPDEHQVRRTGEGGKESGRQSKPKAPERPVDITRCDIRVGKILSAMNHPDADTLYVEEIDVGEDQPRTVVSGLKPYMSLEDLQDRLVIVMCNLKPMKARGIKSHAMVMAASNKDAGLCQLLDPPSAAKIGERVTFEGLASPEGPDAQLNPKKKIWESVRPHLATNAHCLAMYKGKIPFMTSAGPVTVKSLANCTIS